MFVILSVLVWQETGIIRGGEALFLLWIQRDYFFLECVSLEEMYKTDQGNLHIPSKGLKKLRAAISKVEWQKCSSSDL